MTPESPPASHRPRVLSVCVGQLAPLTVGDPGNRQTELSGIRKRPVSTLAQPDPVVLSPLGLAGDEQADPTEHGGLDQAVYLYPVEHYAFWTTVRGQAGQTAPLQHGMLGENLTISGLLEGRIHVGDRLRLGRGPDRVELRVTRPRSPCHKFNAVMGFSQAAKMMVQSGYTGFYCSVIRPGILAAGDEIDVVSGDRVATIEQAHRLQHRR